MESIGSLAIEFRELEIGWVQMIRIARGIKSKEEKRGGSKWEYGIIRKRRRNQGLKARPLCMGDATGIGRS